VPRVTPKRKWRPALWMVLGGALLATLAFSFAGLVALRYLGPQFGFRTSALALGALILAATSALGWVLSRLLLRPITAITDQAATLRHQPQHPPAALQHYGTRELRDLAHSITAMAATLQNREGQMRSFTDHVTHELKTPVTAIRAAAELLSDGDLSLSDQQLVTEILGATQQMQTQLDALRRVTAAREPGHHGQTTLTALLPMLRSNHPTLTLTCAEPDTPLPLAASGLQIILTHLLSNAAQHGATEITLTATPETLTVSDNGPGISPGNRAHIFTPFFTTRRETGGTGMGLPITANLLQAHGGTITLNPTTQGTSFTITFAQNP